MQSLLGANDSQSLIPSYTIITNLLKALLALAGAHNDVRAEGKGRSVQRPRKRLKFENVLTVVLLLFLARTRIASLTDYSASKVAKIVVTHKIVSVRAEWYVSQQSSTPGKTEGKVLLA